MKPRPPRRVSRGQGTRRELNQLAENLFEDEATRQAFVDAIQAQESREGALILLQDRPEIRAFPQYRPMSWQPPFIVRLMQGFKASQHPLYAQGAFYSLDFSSVIAASVMLAIGPAPKRILDLCASPGGKSVFAARAFAPDVIICNESLRKRTGILIENLTRCRVKGANVSSADASVWARKASQAFDFVIVDAPCSGQSLLAKGREAPGCFDPAMLDVCVGRQRRILAHALECTAPGGHVLYMTCTFNRKENERVIEWAMRQFEGVEAVEAPAMAGFRSHLADVPCYRLFPQQGLGAGMFSALLRKPGSPIELPALSDELPIFWRSDG